MQKTSIRDVLNIDEFNPLDIDLTYIQNEINRIPTSGIIDIHIAEELATHWLRGAEYCTELLGKATRWMGRKKTERDRALTEAGLRTGQKSVSAQKQLGLIDPEYIDAVNAYTDAEACVLLLEQKHRSLIAAHYLAKELFSKSKTNENANVWQQSDSDKNANEDIRTGKINQDDFDDWQPEV